MKRKRPASHKPTTTCVPVVFTVIIQSIRRLRGSSMEDHLACWPSVPCSTSTSPQNLRRYCSGTVWVGVLWARSPSLAALQDVRECHHVSQPMWAKLRCILAQTVWVRCRPRRCWTWRSDPRTESRNWTGQLSDTTRENFRKLQARSKLQVRVHNYT